MSLNDHPRAYGTAAIAVAFTAGVLLTLGFKDLYPDLERRFHSRDRPRTFPESHEEGAGGKRGVGVGVGVGQGQGRRHGASPVHLEDHESDAAVAAGLEACIGNTPLIQIRSLSEATGRVILAKAEFLNGAGNSPKDRVALNMIREAEAQGLLVPRRGDTIYEGTVGSTGISLATLARARGYRAHICMPDDQALEKSELLYHLGATVERVAVAPITSPDHYINLARRRAAEHAARHADGSSGFFADQFETEANWRAHVGGTGPEIYAQTGGRLDAFVAGAGTGGTISGVARFLKLEAGMDALRVVLADPQGSGLFNKIKYGVMYSPTEREGTRRRQQVDSVVEGVGVNRVTHNLEAGRDLIDDAVKVSDAQAYRMARWLIEKDGIFTGSSSAVNCVAAVATAMKLPPGSRIVTLLCDPGSRHLSKFYKHIKEMGLEEKEASNLFEELGLAEEK